MTVDPQVGYYLVCELKNGSRQEEHVSKAKRCTCGGSALQPCPHIKAVAGYLRRGGRRARRAPKNPTCPICGAQAKALAPHHNSYTGHKVPCWHCPEDPSHYWLWRGEQNGGAVRRFLTQPRPAKQGAFYEMAVSEREAFLEQAGRRMHAGGYNPYA